MALHSFDVFLDPAPPNLAKAFGYSGNRRWVAFFWSKENDVFFSYDGAGINTISIIAWSGLLEHPYTVSLHQRKKTAYEFGDFHKNARHWLLLDRKLQKLYAGRRDHVLKYLRVHENEIVHELADHTLNWSLNPMAGELHQVECMACWLDNRLHESKNEATPSQPLYKAWSIPSRLLTRSPR